MDNNYIFLFDLDGTLTKIETLPLIAELLDMREEINFLTRETIYGNIPFTESFIRRVEILKKVPVSKVREILTDVPLFEKIVSFIHNHSNCCYVVTNNLDIWVSELCENIGCSYFSSSGIVNQDSLIKIEKILKKEDIVDKFKSEGKNIVYIGDGDNDCEAMRSSDIKIASGLVHTPSKSIISIADFVLYDESALFRLLNQILYEDLGKTLILNCAGIGSRLGLCQTKTLIEINNEVILGIILRQTMAVDDVRIVIGFQGQMVIEKALKYRRDITFVFNHDYFHTKTGHSLFLASRFAKKYCISWDGDLLVHPADVENILSFEEEFLCCSPIICSDPIYVIIKEDNVTGFTREVGAYEWSGPLMIIRDKISIKGENIYDKVLDYLPIKAMVIRAFDIDTFDDYSRAFQILNSWNYGE